MFNLKNVLNYGCRLLLSAIYGLGECDYLLGDYTQRSYTWSATQGGDYARGAGFLCERGGISIEFYSFVGL